MSNKQAKALIIGMHPVTKAAKFNKLHNTGSAILYNLHITPTRSNAQHPKCTGECCGHMLGHASRQQDQPRVHGSLLWTQDGRVY